MTTDNTNYLQLIKEQRELLEIYRTLQKAYDDRQEKLAAYLEKIVAIIRVNNPDSLEIGLTHLDKVIASMKPKEKTA